MSQSQPQTSKPQPQPLHAAVATSNPSHRPRRLHAAVARVLAVATEGDMALLTVDDDAFWKGAEPVVFGVLPQLQDA
eukprot:196336-Chlamydomonas_euryale.AAC.1